MTREHTPGPWISREVPETDEPTIGYWIDADNHEKKGFPIANVKHFTDDHGEANARLIAAAPELLEACQAVANDTTHPIAGNLQAMLRIAIAKAKGD